MRSALAPPRLPGSYLVVELTNRCSLACVHCSVAEGPAHPHHAEVGRLDPALFEALLADLVAVGGSFDTLVLFWLGEPLLHPHFGALYRSAVRTAARHGTFAKVEVHTNATHLDPARLPGLLNDAAVPQVWHFSIDAATAETFRRVKGRDRFELVQHNVRAFVSARARRGARWPRPVFQFIVGSNNAHEVSRFRRTWQEACEAAGTAVRTVAGHVPEGEDAIVFFRQLDCPTAEEQERKNALFRRVMVAQGLALPAAAARGERVEADNLSPCAAFWKSPVVSWRGELTTCTRDNLLENRLGSLHEASFSELWWGPDMAARRARVARGHYQGLPPCRTCFIPRSLNHGELTADDLTRQAAWDGLAIGGAA